MVISVTGMTISLTVTVQVASLSPALAMIVACPAPTACTVPISVTVATLSSELLQVTVGSVASSGFTVAPNVKYSPTVIGSSFTLTVTSVTAMKLSLTVTLQVASLSPALAVIVASPAATAVTFPVWSTDATLSSELLHTTVLSVALSGATVATRVSDVPVVSSSSVLFSVTEVKGMTVGGAAA